jgi:ABC-type uncharacterized transport system fused permease/ATPase subunit
MVRDTHPTLAFEAKLYLDNEISLDLILFMNNINPVTHPAENNIPVYFFKLMVENVRCFGKTQTLNLSDGNGKPARWTILLGDNGVGKTTLFLVPTLRR